VTKLQWLQGAGVRAGEETPSFVRKQNQHGSPRQRSENLEEKMFLRTTPFLNGVHVPKTR
jgi:hypothetical protein